MSVDEEERALWRLHVATRDWETFEHWAIVAARGGFPWGLDFVRASRRYPRTVHRAQHRSAARHGALRVGELREKVAAAVRALRTRGRRALRELRRAERSPRNCGPIPERVTRGIRALLADLTDLAGQRIRRRRRALHLREFRSRLFLVRIRPTAAATVELDGTIYESARGWYVAPVDSIERMRANPNVFELALQSEAIEREMIEETERDDGAIDRALAGASISTQLSQLPSEEDAIDVFAHDGSLYLCAGCGRPGPENVPCSRCRS